MSSRRARASYLDWSSCEVSVRGDDRLEIDKASEYALHEILSDALHIAPPIGGDQTSATEIRDDNRRADIAIGSVSASRTVKVKQMCVPGAVARNPVILGEDKAVELPAEVLRHVTTLGFGRA